MVWIRLFAPLFVGLMGIYYGMVLLQCFTPWFKMTNREIRFGRCLIPFYYWIAPVEEKNKHYVYEDEDDDDIQAREEKITSQLNKSKENKN